MTDKRKVKVLFVCTGNICRSPTAQGVFTKQVQHFELEDMIEIDSAGTLANYAGKPPDPRAQSAAIERGYDVSMLRSRHATALDCETFDYILVMDQMNILDLREICPKSCWRKIRLLMDFAPNPQPGREIPDPFGGKSNDFETALDLIEGAARGLLKHIRQSHGI